MVSPRPFAVLLEQVWAVLGSKRHRRYMNIWLDLASGAGQSDGEPPLSPALFLATIQGMYSLTAIGRPAVAKTAMIELSACV